VVAAGEISSTIPGGQLMITTDVENFPGFPEGIMGPDLMDKFFKQAKRFNATIIEENAHDFDFSSRPFKLKIGNEAYSADSIILSNGAAARWLNLPGEVKYRNNGVSACATCDGPLPCFRNKEIYVLGGGDSAVEEATFLSKFASVVYLLVRTDKLRASKIMQDRAQGNPKIKILLSTTVAGYLGEDSLTGLVLEDTRTKEKREVSAAGLFMAIGHEPLTKELKGTSIDLDTAGYIEVHNNVYTNIEGVFASGDVHDTHYRQAITAAGFGCMSAIACERWLEEKKA